MKRPFTIALLIFVLSAAAYHQGTASLEATSEGNGRIYFDTDKSYRLTPAENGSFIIGSPGREVVRFDAVNGRISGLTLNPGPWAIQAKKMP
jgi:hypothetical protein